jgi:hypothetical protein
MFATKLNLFSIRTIPISVHIELILKPVCIPNIIMVDPILKQLVVPVNVLAMKLVIPPDNVKQHLPKIYFHPEVRKMIVDETPTKERIQDLTIARWTITKEE